MRPSFANPFLLFTLSSEGLNRNFMFGILWARVYQNGIRFLLSRDFPIQGTMMKVCPCYCYVEFCGVCIFSVIFVLCAVDDCILGVKYVCTLCV